jgi:hypothetical protein
MNRVLPAALLVAAAVAAPGLAMAQHNLTQTRMQIYAGPLHREYLGCLNCDQYDVNSVWNSHSPFGWDNDYPNNSHFSIYRAAHGRYSACDPFAPEPPILIDTSGKTYGHLNVSEIGADSICGPHGQPSICQPLKGMCIRNNNVVP